MVLFIKLNDLHKVRYNLPILYGVSLTKLVKFGVATSILKILDHAEGGLDP